ncbi:MAG: PilX N-terminal domain-containing pilus assembly protein [Desulfobacterales bacterium]|jgi:Tfp pilus assembly protein PilX
MNKTFSPLMNADGSVIVFTLMVLTLLTIVGLASIRTADTEVEIAGTELLYQRNFYLAEGAAMEGAHWLDHNTITASSGPTWMEMTPGALNDAFWDNAQTSALDADASFIAAYEGPVGGSSLDVNKTKLHEISIYGRSQKRGLTEIRLGYRKAF